MRKLLAAMSLRWRKEQDGPGTPASARGAAASRLGRLSGSRGAEPVGVVHVVSGLHGGGMERVVATLAMGLDRQCFRPEVTTFEFRGELAEELHASGVPVRFDARRPGPVDPAYLRRLVRHLRRERPAVLHCHNTTAWLYGALAGRAAQVPVVVYTEHGRKFPPPRQHWLVHRLLARLTTHTVAVARWLRDCLIEYEGVPPARVTVIPNGIDPLPFHSLPEPEQGKAALGLSPATPVVGVVARLVPVKNHGCLLRAWREVVARLPGAQLLVIGEGPEEPRLRALVAGLGLGHSVRFLGRRHDVPRLLAAMDVHALCSHSEGTSLTLLEAMAARRPVVATRVGGNPEVVVDGVTGLLVPPGLEGPLAQALVSLLEDSRRARSLGEAGWQRFSRVYSNQAMVAAYEDLYLESLLEHHPR